MLSKGGKEGLGQCPLVDILCGCAPPSSSSAPCSIKMEEGPFPSRSYRGRLGSCRRPGGAGGPPSGEVGLGLP